MRTRFDTEQIASFEKDGFCSFDTELQPRDVEQLRDILTRLHNENVGFKEGALFDAMGVDDGDAPKWYCVAKMAKNSA